MKNNLLRKAREDHGWTQQHLAQELYVEEQTVRSWESGRRTPTLESRARLCQIFGVTAKELGLEIEAEEDKHSQPSPPSSPLPDLQSSPNPRQGRGDENRRRMLKRVRNRWIPILGRSLYQNIFIDLSFSHEPDAVINPWETIVNESALPRQPLPPNIHIMDIYDESDGALLILGVPGAGKTTILLELTRQLIERATIEENHQIPIVFNLSSWAEKRLSLNEWLIDELNTKYQVPHKLGQSWVTANKVLPLLDGLDEVIEAHRSACVQAINDYRKDNGFVPMVVCSRSDEFFTLNTRITLNDAITIEPLSLQQIENYVSKVEKVSAGKSLQALLHNAGLQEMASTPLMLNIITMTTFHDASFNTILSTEDPIQQRHMIFEKYVEFVLKRRGSTNRYSPEQTKHWLSWLAGEMQYHNQTEFYIERLQQDWLPDNLRQNYNHTIYRIIYGIETATVAALFAWIRGGRVGNISGISNGLLGWLGSAPGNQTLGWMAPGLGGGLEGGGMIGIIFILITFLSTILIDASSIEKTSQSLPWKQRIHKSIAKGLFGGLISGGITILASGFILLLISKNFGYTFPRALGFGIFSGLIFGLTLLLNAGLREEKSTSRKSKKWMNQLGDGISIALCAGFGFGIVSTLLLGFKNALLYTIVISFGCIFFGISGENLLHLGEIRTAETTNWSWSNIRQHIIKDSVKSVFIGLSITVIVVIIIALASTLFYGKRYGIEYGAVQGLIIGFIVCIVSLLTSILNHGWSSTMLSEHQLTQPNEGIRRSMRNSIVAGCIFGPISGLASGLICGMAFAFAGISGWPLLATGYGIVFAIIFTLQFALVYGGIACIEHYFLRYYLYRSQSIAWDYSHFLNYASERILLRRIGGGYMFSHRLLLEYFTSLEQLEQTK